MKRLLMILALVIAPMAVIAQPATQPSVDAIRVVRGLNGQKTYYLSKGIVVFGTRHRPNAVYVMERSRISYDWARLQARFVDRIKATVNKDPF